LQSIPIIPAVRLIVMDRNQKQFMRTADSEGENTPAGSATIAVAGGKLELANWREIASRSRFVASDGSGWSHWYDSIVNAVTIAVNNPAYEHSVST
jgi:hypothetical protein